MTVLSGFLIFLAIVLALNVFFLPTIIATHRHHTHKTAIIVLNYASLLMPIGWIAAIVWCALPVKKEA